MPLVCGALPREVDADAIALDGDGAPPPAAARREAVVVDEVLGLVDAVGDGGDGLPGQALGVVLELRAASASTVSSPKRSISSSKRVSPVRLAAIWA